MDGFHTVYSFGNGEITEKKSRFIADVFPVQKEEEAAGYLDDIRKKYWDARHHCWAYVIGRNPCAERFSDDGEPAGTAGKPILEVIRGRELTDVLVVVTRYFGGTLLGTGGLVRAYTQAASRGLANTMIITKYHGFKLKIQTDYTGLGKIQHILAQMKVPVVDTVYTDSVELTALVADTDEKTLHHALTEGTAGQAVLRKSAECWFADTGEGIRIFDM